MKDCAIGEKNMVVDSSITCEASAGAGAALLDIERPGWHRDIDIGLLKLSSCCDCVLGQIFRREPACKGPDQSFRLGLDTLFPQGNPMTGEDATVFGFDLMDESEWRTAGSSWVKLKKAWLSQINTRLEEDNEQNQGEEEGYVPYEDPGEECPPLATGSMV